MKYLEFLKFIFNKLTGNSFINPKEEAERIYEYILGINIRKAIIDNSKNISKKHIILAEKIISKRKTGMPLAYILGYEYFFGYKFFVNKNVLVPRQDSETLVETTIKLINNNDKLLDLCCGSGCLGLSIAKNINISKLTLLDISKKALAVAKKNAKILNLNASFLIENLLNINKIISLIENHDIIISNPPYIAESEKHAIDQSVLDFEPNIALFGGNDGLLFYKCIIKAIEKAKKKPKYLILEIGSTQKNDIMSMFDLDYNTKSITDVCGRDRVVCIKLC